MSVNGVAGSGGIKPQARAILKSHLDSHFGSTLGTVEDIENIMMGLIQRESSFNPSARHPSVGDFRTRPGYTANRVWNTPTFQKIRQEGTSAQIGNLEHAFQAWGLMGSMGWNHIKKAGTGGGPTEIESSRPDLADQLMVEAGESVRDKLDGPGNMSSQILAGLVMWEAKWKQVTGSGTSWKAGRYTFSSRILAATAAYLGLGPKDLKTGLTPEAYARSVVFGDSYRKANGSTPSSTQMAATSNPSQAENKENGPIRTAASGNSLQTPGC